MIEYYHEIKKSSNFIAPSLIVVKDSKISLNKELVIRDNTFLTDNWIGGFLRVLVAFLLVILFRDLNLKIILKN